MKDNNQNIWTIGAIQACLNLLLQKSHSSTGANPVLNIFSARYNQSDWAFKKIHPIKFSR